MIYYLYITAQKSCRVIENGIMENLELPYSVAAGKSHSIFIDNDGRVHGAGSNIRGQLGFAVKNKFRDTPQLTPLADKKILAVSCGVHSLFLDGEGQVWSCGLNTDHQLGHEEQGISKVEGIDTPVILIVAGYNFSLFLDENGVVWSCGDNEFGQLGFADSKTRNIPEAIKNLPKIKAIAAGNGFSAFLDVEGCVWSTGWKTNPVAIQKLDANYLPPLNVIAATHDSLYTVDQEGNVWYAQKRDGREFPRLVFNKVFPNLKNVKFIACGKDHALILLENGEVYGVGDNQYGQLGFPFQQEKLKATFKEEVRENLKVKKEELEEEAAGEENEGKEAKAQVDGNSYGPILNPPRSCRYDRNQGCLLLDEDFLDNQPLTIAELPIPSSRVEEPVKINVPKIVYLSTFYQHSILLDHCGEVWVCGRNTYTQLGLGNHHHSYHPVKNQNLPVIKTKFGIQKVRVAANN